jgi:hypothetical protein
MEIKEENYDWNPGHLRMSFVQALKSSQVFQTFTSITTVKRGGPRGTVFGLQMQTRVICCAARFKFLASMSDIAFPEERYALRSVRALIYVALAFDLAGGGL